MGMNILNPLVSIYGIHQNNKNIDKQLQAQSVENQKMREHNLQLAQLQNEWNQQQWNLENAYNSPEAQMKRMKDAGLNPDMMYGGGVSGNLAASSPDMTAGAPATPMDWSALGSKKSVLDALMSQKSLELMDAQVDNVKANSEKTLAETTGTHIDNKYKEAEKLIGLELSEQLYKANEVEFERLQQALEEDKLRYNALSTEYLMRQMEHAFKSESMQYELKILANELKKSDFEVEKMVEAKTLELRGRSLDNQLKEYAVMWEDPGILESLGGKGVRTLLKVLLMALK